ncbi:3-hydroxybutyrate oligomer hydrolase family protein [Ramlibacter tataouinensis]|uniref:D-(-)-3-hydroxybutyrate oligomer hydrolase-like protein n=1 Tax=Ramlibacter tataouinensis (strain ATCC BAA-407 / DSM 14655 / LMG 21543 / TTB310) TaxID=365046 RepID=F5Y5G3_RAMTT|nr:3-hydroxybutyrate oligomer hydrolase family protein [Ramlibacter tataouinensis]AEG92659.1 D-(-)-3-hydroxybutyrate oligomer hydrolase-like protein [Ramlibacter tataouinensis TTB310]
MRTTADPYRAAAVRRILPLCAIASAVLAGCGGGADGSASVSDVQAANVNAKVPPGVDLPAQAMPLGVTQHSVTDYPATTVGTGATAQQQDLLTGGIGKTGLGAPVPPLYADANNPTAAELRRNALYSNYRAILDPSVAGGYGRFYGPNVTADGTVTANEGLIPGREYLASLDDGSGRKRVVMAVLIPDSFDTGKPCLVLGPSSGSRGVYGAIGTAGEWGLKKGCAVALTDAGKGVGLHDLGDDTVNKVDGTRATRTAAGVLAHFAADITESARAAFNAVLPHRFALKQVHSQQNPEKDWGSDTLAVARYAFHALNDRFGGPGSGRRFVPANTLVIAGSASNGGAAVLRAAELDRTGLIDGVVASEPVTQMPTTAGYGISFGGTPVSGYGRNLADLVTYGNLYQPCAAMAADAAMTEFSFFNFMTIAGMNGRAQARCASLAAKGLVNGATAAERAADALARLRGYGWTVEHDRMHNAHWGLGNGPILSAMYPVAYGRFSVLDNVCGTSFAAADTLGNPVAATAAAKAQSFAIANGTANGTPAAPIYDNSLGGSKAWQWAVSASTGTADFGLDTALCQRALVTGADPVTGAPLTDASTPTADQSAAVRRGIAEVAVSGDLGRTPTIIVSGRSDALVPVNNNSRAYAAYNLAVEGTRSQLRYVEVTNAQHFDTFIPLAGFDTRFVPLHGYFNQAMDLMHAHLTAGAPLPPSQVVRTTPRGGVPGAAPALTAAHIPPISAAPAAADRIGFSGTTLTVPQ